MKLRILIIAALGLALALYLVTYVGMGAVLSAAVTVGWSGFAILCLYALGLFLILGTAWYVLPPDPSATGLWVFVWARMVRDAPSTIPASWENGSTSAAASRTIRAQTNTHSPVADGSGGRTYQAGPRMRNSPRA